MGKYYYISFKVPDSEIVDLNSVVGTVELNHTPEGEACEELIKTGNFNLTPYGFGEKDKDGNITKFTLIGFTLSKK